MNYPAAGPKLLTRSGGTQIDGSLGLVLQLTDNFRLVPSIGFNYADDNYSDAFYSINSAGAANSGIEEFGASGGLEYTQVAFYAVRKIDERWTVTGTIAFNTLKVMLREVRLQDVELTSSYSQG